ncbi:MAG: NAD(+) diphosphatase [Burkholderiales bacterium]|nr:NAD(+) diphosphatase [Ferrovum sp.]
MDFQSILEAPDQSAGEQLWFIFQGSHLLVTHSEGTVGLPNNGVVSFLANAIVRHHVIGQLEGRVCHGIEINVQVPPPSGYIFASLRSLFGRTDEVLLALAGRALQIVDWDRTHLYCGHCGTPTVLRAHERVRSCPSCQLMVYPRIAPVVMGLILRDQELLLARSPHFAPGVYSAIAGYCEPGESLEMALKREIREEVGLVVRDIQYFKSQSWPFPHSLMVAFTCHYQSGVVIPQPGEIEDARWFSIDALPGLPHPVSIARQLIDATLLQMISRHHALH